MSDQEQEEETVSGGTSSDEESNADDVDDSEHDDSNNDDDDEDSSEYSEESSFEEEPEAGSSDARCGVERKDATWLSEKEAKLVGYFNAARTKPKKFAATMNEMKGTHFQKAGEIWKPDYDITNSYMPIQTRERLDGFQAAIEYVRKQPNMQRLHVSKGLSLACQDLIADQFENGARGHITSDGASFRDRAERYGALASDLLSESLVYGHEGALENCVWMIFSDGKRDRKDRENVFNPGYNVIGVAMGAHAEWGSAACILFADTYDEADQVKLDERDHHAAEQYDEAREASYLVRKSAQGCCALM
jgi:uncharacterized protein YkwD